MQPHPPAPGIAPTAADQAGGPPLRIAAVGMHARQVKVLELTFQGPCRDACVLAEEQEAQACIVDMDSYQARKVLEALRERHPRRPLVLLSLAALEPELVGQDLVLAKPIRLEELVERLAVLRERAMEESPPPVAPPPPRPEDWGRPAAAVDMEARGRAARLLDSQQAHALVGTAPDVDPSDPQQLAKAYYDPGRFLQSLVTQARDSARARGQGVRIRGPWPEIVLDPTQGLAQVLGADSRLRPYCLQPSILIQGRLDYVDRSLVVRGQADTIDIDALIWKLALWASRGRLPLDTPVDVPVVLHRWPNFTRLLLAPGAMSIAALWAHEPHTLIHTAERLNLPQRSVFAFYSAAAALSLAQCLGSPSAGENAPAFEHPGSRRRGLIGRIVQRLHAYL